MPATPHKSTPPRAVSKTNAKAVLVYFPAHVVTAMDELAVAKDMNRSQLTRLAIREALQRRGIAV